MTTSADEKKLGFCLGYRLPSEAIVIREIVVYARSNHSRQFELEIIHDFENDSPHFAGACHQFYFDVKNSENIIFAARDRIFIWNYKNDSDPTILCTI
jgi:hypothetical protein